MVTSDGGGHQSMKVAQLRDVLRSASQLYRESGNAVHSSFDSTSFPVLCGRDAMTVSAFAALLAKVTPVGQDLN